MDLGTGFSIGIGSGLAIGLGIGKKWKEKKIKNKINSLIINEIVIVRNRTGKKLLVETLINEGWSWSDVGGGFGILLIIVATISGSLQSKIGFSGFVIGIGSGLIIGIQVGKKRRKKEIQERINLLITNKDISIKRKNGEELDIKKFVESLK